MTFFASGRFEVVSKGAKNAIEFFQYEYILIQRW